MSKRRPLGVWLVLLAVSVALGLGSRRYAAVLPGLVSAYTGDILWALAAFLGLGLVLRHRSTAVVAAAALGFSALIELSQLYHAPWIDAIRRSTLGALLLGWGFLWSDLACYAVGVAVGAVLEFGVGQLLRSRHSGPESASPPAAS